MARPQQKKHKQHRASHRPAPQPTAPAALNAPPELREVIEKLSDIARESGWGTIAQVIKEQDQFEPEVLLDFLARNMGREVLPLLRGAALDSDADVALAALKALPLLGTRAAGEALVEAHAAYPEGERAKLAWQGVQALQARGINVSVPEPEGVRREPPKPQVREVFSSLPDGVGTRSVYARAQDHYGVWQTIVAVWNDRAGVKDGFVMPIPNRQWQNYREENARGGIRLIPVPVDYARWEIGQARRLNAETGLEIGEHLEDWDQVVGGPASGYEPPDPLAGVRALPAEKRAELTGHLGCLLHHVGVFQTWAIEPADVRPWWDERQKLATEQETPDENDEALDALLAKAASETITPEDRTRYVQRLTEVSRKLRWDGRNHEADIAAAVALQIEDAKDPGDVELFRHLAENGLVLLAEILDDGEDPEALRYDPMAPMKAEEE